MRVFVRPIFVIVDLFCLLNHKVLIAATTKKARRCIFDEFFYGLSPQILPN